VLGALALALASEGSAQGAARPVVRDAPTCQSIGSTCVDVPLIFGMALAPGGRHLYVLSWEPGERRVHRIVGWSLGSGGELDFQAPVACVEQESAVAHIGCSRGATWPAFRSTDDPGPEWGALAVSGDGRHVYVTGFDAIVVFSRDPSTADSSRRVEAPAASPGIRANGLAVVWRAASEERPSLR
jgi:hypothetical protein